jgi:siroheme synthase (precorrin-2 oxidase/ferrochelatase)
MTNTLFPVFLKTETAHFLIVGGGNVGLEKTETLLRQNPEIRITVVATYFHPKLVEIGSKHQNITFYERPFEEIDLLNKDFVIITTDKPEVNLAVRELAKSKGIKVNAADQPALCDFYLGSIVNKGSLKIAMSTNGLSLSTPERQGVIDVLAMAGQWPDSLRDAVNDQWRTWFVQLSGLAFPQIGRYRRCSTEKFVI